VKNTKLLTFVAIVVSAIAIVSFYVCLFKYSYNFPYFDDFEVILAFLNSFLTTGQAAEKLGLIFEQHSEHRVVFDRVIALAEYLVTGRIDFRSLILIGNAALGGILILCYKSARPKLSWLCFAPICLLLFNFRYFETSFWSMAALQNLWVLCFVFASLYFLFQLRARAMVPAILFGLFATFTSANGMAVFVAGAIVLALDRQLASRKGLIWCAAGIAVVATYFYGYVKPVQHPEVIKPLMTNPLGFSGYVLALLGAVFTENVTVSIIIGCLLVGLAGFLSYQRCFHESPIAYALIIFLLITSILAGLARFGFGVEQALASRYAIVSTLLVVSCYLALVPPLQHRVKAAWWMVILALSICFHYSTYAKYLPARKEEKSNFERDRARIAEGKLSHFNFGWPPLDPRREFPRQVLRESDALGYFSFKFKDDAQILESLSLSSTAQTAHHFDRFQQVGPVLVFLEGWALIKGVDSKDVIPVVCFKEENGNPAKYIVLKQSSRPDIAKEFDSDRVDHSMSGFETVFNRAELKPGKYTLTLFLVGPDFKVAIEAGPTLLGQ
jgi:hypothetical protein